MSASSRHHTIAYVELTTDDLPAGMEFYTAAFGWHFNSYGPEYAGIVAGDGNGEVGGLNATDEGSVGGSPFVLLYSDDLDATAAAVESAGGTLTKGPYEFPGGRRFHFTDPSGNELGVWQDA